MSEMVTNKIKKVIVLNGILEGEEKKVKRTGYTDKVASVVSMHLRNGYDVKLSAITDLSLANLSKAMIKAKGLMSSYGKELVVKDMMLEEIELKGENKDKKNRKTLAKVFLLGVK